MDPTQYNMWVWTKANNKEGMKKKIQEKNHTI